MTNTREYSVYTGKQAADKAIHTLKGILLGINLDGEVNQLEIEELNQWAKIHKEFVNRNPFREFIVSIEQITSGNIPAKETIEDLYWLTQKYESDSYYFDTLTTDLQILQGLCHGILSDGIVHDKEVQELNNWLDKHEHLKSYYPYDEIRSLLLNVLSDGKIDDDEKIVLKAYFSQFIKLNNNQIQQQLKDELVNVEISGLCTSDPFVVFQDKSFCITGVLKRGSRTDMQNDIKKLGGRIVESINKNTDYLIIGDNGNPAWAFSCYGRKVERAMELRKEGYPIMLIHEFDFGDILDDSK